MMTEKIQKKLRLQFEEWLKASGHKKTPERMAILNLICEENSHFNLETLHDKMKQKPYRVSRATLYNTIRLLQEAGIIIPHRIQSHCNEYEISTDPFCHGHIICPGNEPLIECKHPELEKIVKEICAAHSISLSRFALYVWGHPARDQD